MENDAEQPADEIEFNFQGVPCTDEEESVSIEIIVDNIRLEAEGCNFTPPLKSKKMNTAQANSNMSHKPEARYCIRCLHKNLYRTWISCKPRNEFGKEFAQRSAKTPEKFTAIRN